MNSSHVEDWFQTQNYFKWSQYCDFFSLRMPCFGMCNNLCSEEMLNFFPIIKFLTVMKVLNSFNLNISAIILMFHLKILMFNILNFHICSALERKQADLEQMLGHRLQGCQQVASTYDVLMKDVVDFSEWLRDTDLQVKRSEPMGATVEEGEVLLQEHFVSGWVNKFLSCKYMFEWSWTQKSSKQFYLLNPLENVPVLLNTLFTVKSTIVCVASVEKNILKKIKLSSFNFFGCDPKHRTFYLAICFISRC